MTVIAWDGHVLAADKFAVQEGLCRVCTKIVKWDGHLLAGAGPLTSILAMHAWFKAGARPEDVPVSQTKGDDWCDYLVIFPDKSIQRFENSAHAMTVEEDQIAIGNGAKYAYGAMAAGATAVKAVEIACRYAEGCGGGVDILRLDRVTEKVTNALT